MAYTPSSPDNIRLTITVSPDVHAAFKRLAESSSMSIGRAMGEWLGDTLEAVEFMAVKVEQARSAPKIVVREMHAYALGLADETEALMSQLRERGHADRAKATASSGPVARPPRPVIRGGKSPAKRKASKP